MSSISFVRVDTQEVIGIAPMADWWMVVGELCSTIVRLEDQNTRAKLMELMSLGNDFQKPPRRVQLSELDLVDWNWACSVTMIRILKQVGLDSLSFIQHKDHSSIDMSKLWSHKASTAFVELLALNMALIECRTAVEAREVRIPFLKVI